MTANISRAILILEYQAIDSGSNAKYFIRARDEANAQQWARRAARFGFKAAELRLAEEAERNASSYGWNARRAIDRGFCTLAQWNANRAAHCANLVLEALRGL